MPCLFQARPGEYRIRRTGDVGVAGSTLPPALLPAASFFSRRVRIVFSFFSAIGQPPGWRFSNRKRAIAVAPARPQVQRLHSPETPHRGGARDVICFCINFFASMFIPVSGFSVHLIPITSHRIHSTHQFQSVLISFVVRSAPPIPPVRQCGAQLHCAAHSAGSAGAIAIHPFHPFHSTDPTHCICSIHSTHQYQTTLIAFVVRSAPCGRRRAVGRQQTCWHAPCD